MITPEDVPDHREVETKGAISSDLPQHPVHTHKKPRDQPKKIY
jgi:hypothetical protein